VSKVELRGDRKKPFALSMSKGPIILSLSKDKLSPNGGMAKT
jgi:hypothetical protein